MADVEPTTVEQIAEYESQLAGILELLEASPGDESLLALKTDLEELLELSRANIAAASTTTAATNGSGNGNGNGESANTQPEPSEELRLPPPPLPPPPLPPPPPPIEADHGIGMTDGGGSSSSSAAILAHAQQVPAAIVTTSGGAPAPVAAAASASTTSTKDKPHKAKKTGSKKPKKVKDFVLPDHLIPNDGDTEAERNKKRRAAKSLKNKWRLQKKEIESSNRQKSWQSFQKKSGGYSSASSGSIFATKEGLNDRVGVVSKKQLTDFGARKRHK